MNENLQRFQEDARRLAEVSRYDCVRLGVVFGRAKPYPVIALSLALSREDLAPPPLDTLVTALVIASQWLIPIQELGGLLTSIDAGQISALGARSFSDPIRVREAHQPISWYEEDNSRDPLRFGTYLRGIGSRTDKLIGVPTKDVDRDVILHSDHAYSSLQRLIRAYTGLEVPRIVGSMLVLFAPSPVRSLTARSENSRLRIEVDGLPGLDTSQFILNIEGTQRDQRLDSKDLHWLSGPPSAPETCTYTSVLEVSDPQPLRANLYLARAPSIALRAEIQRSHQETVPPVSASPEGDFEETGPRGAEDTRLTALRVQSFRLLRSAELRLDDPPLSVVVGPNQSGKSSLLDALQLLSEAARGELATGLVQRRGGIRTLQSRGATTPLRLEAELRTGRGQLLRFRLQLAAVGTYDFVVEQEELAEQVQGEWRPILFRQAAQATLSGTPVPVANEREALLSQLGGLRNPLVQQTRASLAAIAVYPYFRTGASWADPESVPMRRPVRLEPGARLERTGNNLPAALFSLREERPEDWQDFIGIVRLAFPSLKDLRFRVVGQGLVQLFWDELTGGQFDASELSDGTLHFLACLCAIFQPGSALIAVDEPEAHLHPDALMRLMSAARSLSERHPILFTTQSDALIGLLDDAPRCVVVAKREDQEARLVRPEAEQLDEWLKSFSLREMRRELEGWDPTP